MGDILVEPALPEHARAIAELLTAAFGREDEARLVEALRAEGRVVGELVALDGDTVKGHILFTASPRSTAPGTPRTRPSAPKGFDAEWVGLAAEGGGQEAAIARPCSGERWQDEDVAHIAQFLVSFQPAGRLPAQEFLGRHRPSTGALHS